jgi:hypothetical protein
LLPKHQKVLLLELISLIRLFLNIGIGRGLNCVRVLCLVIPNEGEAGTVALRFLALVLATCQAEVLGDLIEDLRKGSDFNGFLYLCTWGIGEDASLA